MEAYINGLKDKAYEGMRLMADDLPSKHVEDWGNMDELKDLRDAINNCIGRLQAVRDTVMLAMNANRIWNGLEEEANAED